MLKTFVDLFCGLGGFRLALEAEGLECVFSCDVDEKVMECYQENFGPEFCYTRDIRDIPASFIPDCDIITGGFPCQAFSVAKTSGKRGLEDKRADLFKEILRIAEVKKPKVLLLENVPGILSSSNNLVVQRIYKGLENIGYEVRYMNLKASYFGVPQARERVYFVATRKDLNLRYAPPEPTYEPVCIRDILLDLPPEELEKLIIPTENCHLFDEPRRGVGKPWVGDLRLFTAGYIERRPRGGTTLRKNGNIRIGYQIFDDKGVSPTITATEGKDKGGRNCVATKLPYKEKKSIYRDHRIYDSRGQAPVLDGRKRNDKINIRDIGQGYEIHDPKGVSPSIIGKDHEKSGHVKIAEGEQIIRRLHIIEYKRLMAFPDDHVVSSGGRGYGQLGNAVIPKMVQLIYRGIKDA